MFQSIHECGRMLEMTYESYVLAAHLTNVILRLFGVQVID